MTKKIEREIEEMEVDEPFPDDYDLEGIPCTTAAMLSTSPYYNKPRARTKIISNPIDLYKLADLMGEKASYKPRFHDFLDLYLDNGIAYVYSNGKGLIEAEDDKKLQAAKEEYCKILKTLGI